MFSIERRVAGFNYAYRRTATPATAATPNSTSSPLPNAQPNPKASISTSTSTDKPIPPHLANRSNASTPPNPAKELSKDTLLKSNGAPTPSTDKTEKEKQKKKEKKERKDREKADRETKEADEPKEGGDLVLSAPTEQSTRVHVPKSGKATPEASNSATADVDSHAGLKSPTTDSTGGRTPTSKRAPRNPWTLFMRMPVPANESELREFFGEAKDGIVRVSCPPGYGKTQRIAYVEFGDEEAMKAGLEKHAEVRKHFPLIIGRLLIFVLEIKRHDS